MNWKTVLYKVLKGAISGAAAGLAAVQFGAIPEGGLVPVLVAAAVGGALHGAANALEQKAGK